MARALRKAVAMPFPLPSASEKPCGASKRIVLAYNPTSGNFCASAMARLRSALERAGHDVSCQNSREFRFAPHDKVDLVCAYGGDGTARTVVGMNGPRAAQAPYCVFPSGTINLLAREAGYPGDTRNFARLIDQRAPAPCHFGLIDDEAFLCCASVGPDAAAVAQVSEWLKRRIGRLAYGVAALRQMWRWPRQMFTITVDGRAITGEAMFVCKGRYYAGPWVIDEQAALSSDSFRVLIMPRARRRDMVQLALSAIIHPSLGNKAWHRMPGREIRIESDHPAPIQADGDIVAQTPATLSISPFSLNFL
jgi:diacylglycerol kinase (ATP)